MLAVLAIIAQADLISSYFLATIIWLYGQAELCETDVSSSYYAEAEQLVAEILKDKKRQIQFD